MAKKTIAIDVQFKGKEAQEGTEELKSSIEGVTAASDKMSDEMKAGFKASKDGADKAAKGVKGFGKSIKGLVASLGIIALLSEAFMVLKDLLMTNQNVADSFATGFKVVEIIFGRVSKAVENLVDNINDLKEINLENIIDTFRNFGKEVSESGEGALDLARKVTELENSVKKADAQQRIFALTMQKEIEIQRQIRDDVSKTTEERIAANDKIEELVNKQLEGEQRVANQRLLLAQIEQEIANDNIESQVKVLEAKAEIIDIEERLTGVLSEQKTNREALRLEETQRLDELINNYETSLDFLSGGEFESEFENQLQSIADRRFQLVDEYSEALDGMRNYLKENNEGMTNEQIENHEKMLQLEKVFNKKWTDLSKAEADIRRQYVETSASQLASALGSIASNIENQSREGAIAAKVLGVAQIAIDTAVAISGAIAQAQSLPFPGNIAAIATGIAAVVSGIASATQTINSANIPGPTAPAPSAPNISTASPQFNPVTTNTTELGNTQQAELAPIQAFVVETELTGTQENISQIEGQAEFGDLGG